MLVKMVHYTINTDNAPGVPLLGFRRFASGIGADQTLALTLWHCSVHETRLLATVIARPTETDRRPGGNLVGEFPFLGPLLSILQQPLPQMPFRSPSNSGMAA